MQMMWMMLMTPTLAMAVPEDAGWAGYVVLTILILFAAAAAVGVVVRMNMPEQLPSTHSHDEPPGASHHHGASGTH